MVWDEHFYVPDACSYLNRSVEMCGQAREAGFVHPPLGPWLIAGGIAVFGYDANGWRAAVVAAGTVTVLATYLLGRALGSTRGASLLAAALLALDPLHLVFSRVATLDAFVTLFGVLIVLGAVLDYKAGMAMALRVWRPLTGLLVGLAVATKWSAVLLLPLVVLIIALGDRRRRTADGLRGTGWGRWTYRMSWAAAAGLLVGVYVLSYVGRLSSSGPIWSYSGFLRDLVRRHESMLRFHLGLDADLGTHPYASPPWSWPLATRPPVLAFETSGEHVQETLGLVDPLVLVPAICLSAWAVLVFVRRRRFAPAVVTGAAALSCWLPWVALAWDRTFVFVYYLLPAVPFLALTFAEGVDGIFKHHRRAGVTVGASIVMFSTAMVIWFWPLLTSGQLTYDEWRDRILLEQCGGTPPVMPDGRIGPASGEGGPPGGWCWL